MTKRDQVQLSIIALATLILSVIFIAYVRDTRDSDHKIQDLEIQLQEAETNASHYRQEWLNTESELAIWKDQVYQIRANNEARQTIEGGDNQ